MKTHFKFHIILTVSLFFVFVFNANAQNNHLFDHQSKRKFNHLDLNNPAIERPYIFDDAVPQKFLKNNFTEDLLDSVVYLSGSFEYKESFAYNGDKKILIHLDQKRIEGTEKWVNDNRISYTFDERQNLTSTIYELWNEDEERWMFIQRRTYDYDANDNITLRLYEEWHHTLGKWVNLTRYNWDYDSNNNQTYELLENWDDINNRWVNNWRYHWTFDPNSNPLETVKEKWDYIIEKWEYEYRFTNTYINNSNIIIELSEDWNVESGIWVNHIRLTKTYDVNDNLLTQLDEGWNQESNTWFTRFLITYTYDLNGNMLTNLQQDWVTNTGLSQVRVTYTYDNNNNKLTYMFEIWDKQRLLWENRKKESFSYDAYGNILSHLYENWNGFNNIWENDIRYFYTYNNFGYILSFLYEEWERLPGIWRLVGKTNSTYLYDQNSNLTNYSNESWQDSIWVSSGGGVEFTNNGNQLSFLCRYLTAYYTPLTDINNSENLLNSFSLSQNYPNPFNPSTTIEYEIPRNERSKMSKVKLVVYDLLGSVVRTLVDEQKSAGKHKVTFDASQLPSGVYFYQISAGSFNQVKKMLLLK